MAEWFYASGEQKNGPVSREQILDLYARGVIRRQDLVWQPGMPQWASAETVLGPPVVDRSPDGPPQLPKTTTMMGGGSSIADYGDFLCWGFPVGICFGVLCPPFSLVLMGLIVLYLLELCAVREAVERGLIRPSFYSNIPPVGMFFLLCCFSPILYPLYMYWRNESGAFKPHPYAVPVGIVTSCLFVVVIVMYVAVVILAEVAKQ